MSQETSNFIWKVTGFIFVLIVVSILGGLIMGQVVVWQLKRSGFDPNKYLTKESVVETCIKQGGTPGWSKFEGFNCGGKKCLIETCVLK